MAVHKYLSTIQTNKARKNIYMYFSPWRMAHMDSLSGLCDDSLDLATINIATIAYPINVSSLSMVADSFMVCDIPYSGSFL